MEPANYRLQTAHYGRMCIQCKFLKGDECQKHEFIVKSGWYCDDWESDGIMRVV